MKRKNAAASPPPPPHTHTLFHQAPLTPRRAECGSGPTGRWAPEECLLIQLMQGVGGGEVEGRRRRKKWSVGNNLSASDGTCGCTARREREGIGHWTICMHLLMLSLCFCSPAQAWAMQPALQHMYYRYILYVSLIAYACIFPNGAFFSENSSWV